MASSDSSISSKARGSNKVSYQDVVACMVDGGTQFLPPHSHPASSYEAHLNRQVVCPSLRKPELATKPLWESGPRSCNWVTGLAYVASTVPRDVADHLSSGKAVPALSFYNFSHAWFSGENPACRQV